MNIPVSRALMGLAAVLLVAFAVIAVQPSTLIVKRRATLGGRYDAAKAAVDDLSLLPRWLPWLGIRDGRVTSGEATGQGARLSWGTGEAVVVDVKALRTIWRFDVAGAKADHFTLTLVLDDQGPGLTGTLEYRSAPRSFFGKAAAFMDDADERVAANLDGALAALAKTLEEAEAERRRALKQAEEEREAARRAAELAARAAKATMDSQDWNVGLDPSSSGDGTVPLIPGDLPPGPPKDDHAHDDD